jgi:hypothetical protein
MDDNMLRYLCSKSLYNISEDLKELEPTVSAVALVLAKDLVEKVSAPEAQLRDKSAGEHNLKIAEEIKEIAEKIRNENV